MVVLPGSRHPWQRALRLEDARGTGARLQRSGRHLRRHVAPERHAKPQLLRGRCRRPIGAAARLEARPQRKHAQQPVVDRPDLEAKRRGGRGPRRPCDPASALDSGRRTRYTAPAWRHGSLWQRRGLVCIMVSPRRQRSAPAPVRHAPLAQRQRAHARLGRTAFRGVRKAINSVSVESASYMRPKAAVLPHCPQMQTQRPSDLPGCQPQLERLALGAWRAPGDAAVSAATAACAIAARCAASRQRGRADSSSEYATCSCAHGARAASAAPANGREGSCAGCLAPWGARRQPCRACAGCRAATPGRTPKQVRCHSRSLANHNVKKIDVLRQGSPARPLRA